MRNLYCSLSDMTIKKTQGKKGFRAIFHPSITSYIKIDRTLCFQKSVCMWSWKFDSIFVYYLFIPCIYDFHMDIVTSWKGCYLFFCTGIFTCCKLFCIPVSNYQIIAITFVSSTVTNVSMPFQKPSKLVVEYCFLK